MTFYSENSLYKNIYKYFEFLSWNKMLFLCPNLDFLSPSGMFFPLLLLCSHSKGTYWALTCCLSSTEPCAQRLHSGRGLYTLFQQKLERLQGDWGALPLPPPLPEEQDRSGALPGGSAARSGQAGLGTLQCVKFCFHNVTILTQRQSSGLPLLNSVASHNAVTSAWVFRNTDGNSHQVT